MHHKDKKGFTLIEIIVTMAIISLMLVVSVANFRLGQQDDVVRFAASRVADALKTEQSDAIGGRIPSGKTVPPQSYGIHFTTNASPTLAQGVVFADNGTQNYRYDAPGEQIGTAVFDPNSNSPKIIVQSICVGGSGPTCTGGSTQSNIDITFASPSGAILFDGNQLANAPAQVVIVLQHTATLKTKTVTINRITGRIDAEY